MRTAAEQPQAMIWINIHIASTVHSPEFVGSSPAERGTWLCVLAYACEIECGGRISGAMLWKDRQWQQACGVTMREVLCASRLLRSEGEDLLVNGYPLKKERHVIQARGIGMAGAMKRWENRDAERHTEKMPNGIKTPLPNANAEGEGEGEGEGYSAGCRSASPLVCEIYDSYPRKVGKASAIRAIGKALKSGSVTPAVLLAKVQAYATATASWAEADRTYIPHPASWINAGRYDDDPSTWVRKPASVATSSRALPASTSQADIYGKLF